MTDPLDPRPVSSPAVRAPATDDARAAPDEPLPTARKLAFGQTFRAVAWSFLGIRRASDHEQDLRQLNPIHVVIAAVVGAAVFVALLVLLVNVVIGAASH